MIISPKSYPAPPRIFVLVLALLLLPIAQVEAQSFSISASSSSPNKLTITPNVVLGGNALLNIVYSVVDETTGGTYTNDDAQEFDTTWCGRRTVQASLTWNVGGGGLSAADVTVNVICPLEIWWEIHNGPTPKYANEHIFMNVGTSKMASARCYLVSPKNASDDDNEVNCPPGTLVSLELPSSYTCGTISVKAIGKAVGDENDTAEITGAATNNPCEADANATATQVETDKAVSLTVGLVVSYDFPRRRLSIEPTSSRASAFLTCTIDGGEAFSCPNSIKTYRSVNPGASYTVVVTAAHGGDTASKTVIHVVPAPTATPTPTAPPLSASISNLSFDAVQNTVSFEPSANKTGAAFTCAVRYGDSPDDLATYVGGGSESCTGGTASSINLGSWCGTLTAVVEATVGTDSETAEQDFSKTCPTLEASFANFSFNTTDKTFELQVTSNIGNAASSCLVNGDSVACRLGTLVEVAHNAGEEYIVSATVRHETQSVNLEGIMVISADGNAGATATPPPGAHVVWPVFERLSPREWNFRAAASEGTVEALTYDFGDGTRQTYTSGFDQTIQKRYADSIVGAIEVSAEIELANDQVITGSRSIMLPPVARAPRPTSPASEASPSPAPDERAARGSCANLPANIAVKATYGITSGIECNRFEPELTGVEDALDAVDLWAYVEQGAEICIQGGGRLIFLDAAYVPRRRSALPSYVKNGMTCAEVNRPGTIVRAPGSPTVLQTPTITPSAAFFPPGFRTPSPTADLRTPTITPSPGLAQAGQLKPLFNCVVNSLFILNFRAAPWGTIMGWFNGAGTALARTPGWYQIVYNGQIGWVSADPTLTVGLGDCA